MNERDRKSRTPAWLVGFIVTMLTAGTASACPPQAPELFPQITEIAKRWSRSGTLLAGTVLRGDTILDAKSNSACPHHPLFALNDAVLETIRARGLVLLGEVHDNAEHHKLRAAVLASHPWLVTTAEGDRRVPAPGVVMEHIRADQRPVLENFFGAGAPGGRRGTAGDLLTALSWSDSGWPDQAMFEPLLGALLDAGLPVYPGEPERAAVRTIVTEGEGAIPAAQRSHLELDQPLGARLHDALLTELEASHCGLVPKSALTNMAFAQRYRDAHQAEAMTRVMQAHGAAVLLAGNGHVRADRGVPFYLRKRSPDRPLLSVLLIELEPGKAEAQAHVPRDPDDKPAADYVVLTPRVARPDPCAAMRAHMSGKKKDAARP